MANGTNNTCENKNIPTAAHNDEALNLCGTMKNSMFYHLKLIFAQENTVLLFVLFLLLDIEMIKLTSKKVVKVQYRLPVCGRGG